MQTQCPQCGAPVDSTASNCKYCGEKFNFQKVTSEPVYVAQPTPVNLQTGYQLPPGINPSWPKKSKLAASLLAIFLGGFGVHKFYLGNTSKGWLYLLFCWTYIPGFIGFFEGLVYLFQSEHNFQVKNKVRIH